MSQPELIRKSGQLFIAAAFAFVTILSGSDPIAIPGSVIAAILLAVGMSGLRSAYRETISPPGRNMLLLGMLGPVLWIAQQPDDRAGRPLREARPAETRRRIPGPHGRTNSNGAGFVGANLCRAGNIITWLDLVWPDCVGQQTDAPPELAACVHRNLVSGDLHPLLRLRHLT